MLILTRNMKRVDAMDLASSSGRITPNTAHLELLISEFILLGRPISEQNSLSIGVHLKDKSSQQWRQVAQFPNPPFPRSASGKSLWSCFPFLPEEDLGGITFSEKCSSALAYERPNAAEDVDRLALQV